MVKLDGDTAMFRPVRPCTEAVYVSDFEATLVTMRCSVSVPARAPMPIDGRLSSFARMTTDGHEDETELPITPQMNPRYLAKPPDWYTRPGSRNFVGST